MFALYRIYIFYFFPLTAQHYCHLLGGKVTNKIQEIPHSKDYHQEDGIRSGTIEHAKQCTYT